jgi:outer membrane autotransporter protein
MTANDKLKACLRTSESRGSIATVRSGARGFVASCLFGAVGWLGIPCLVSWSESSLAQSSSDETISITLTSQKPANTVPLGQSVAYGLSLQNVGRTLVNTGIEIRIDNILVDSDRVRGDGCSVVSSRLPGLWSCGSLPAGSSSNKSFTWAEPTAGIHTIQFDVRWQSANDNDGGTTAVSGSTAVVTPALDTTTAVVTPALSGSATLVTPALGGITAPVTPALDVTTVVVTPALSGSTAPVTSALSGSTTLVTQTIVGNQPPVLSAIGPRSIAAGQTLTVPLNATDPDANSVLNFSQTAVPSFCRLDSAGPNIVCNPLAADTGTFNIKAVVTDNGTPRLSDAETFALTVTDGNQPPILTAIGPRSVRTGQTLTIPLSATDPNKNDALAFSQNGLPGFCNLDLAAPNIVCNPEQGNAGTFNIAVTVTDNGTPRLSDAETFALTVSPPDLPPVLSAIGPRSVRPGQTLTIPLDATDPNVNDVPGVPIALAFSQTGLPSFCSLNGAVPNIVCNPLASNSGTFNVTVTVTDNGTPALSDPETFELTVTRDNQPPVLSEIGPRSVLPGQTLTVQLSATDPDANSGLTFSQTGLPPFCALDALARIVCNPLAPNAGTFNVTVTVTDNGSPPLSDAETFALTVTAANQAPTLSAIEPRSVIAGQTLTIPLSATDPDRSDVLTLSQTGLPSFCDLNVPARNIVCNPSQGTSGTFNVTVIVTDNGTPPLGDSKTFQLTAGQDQAPSVTIQSPTSVQDTDGLPGESIQVSGSATDAEDGVLAPTSFRWFVNGEEANSANAQATVTLRLPTDGNNTVELVVSDSTGQSGRAAATIAVAARVRGEGPISSTPGLSPNEKETAIGLETTCTNILALGTPTAEQKELLDLCGALTSDSTSSSAVEETLEAISGEQVTSQQSTAIDFATAQFANLGARIAALRTLGLQATRGLSTAGLNLDVTIDGRTIPVAALTDLANELLSGGNAGASESESLGRLGIFLNGNVAVGEKDATEAETGFDFDSHALTLGVDYLFTDRLVGGLALGFGKAEADFRNDTGGQESDSTSGTLFASVVDERWFLSAVGGYATVDYDVVRRINSSLLNEDTAAQGSTKGDNVFGGLSVDFDFGARGWHFGPSLSANFIKADIDAFSETGAGGLNLSYGDQEASSTTARAGIRLGRVFSTRIGVINLEWRGDFVREFENEQQIVKVNFINDPFANDPDRPSSEFTILTDEPDEEYALWGLGLTFQAPRNISAFIDYQAVAGLSGITLDEVTAGIRFGLRF